MNVTLCIHTKEAKIELYIFVNSLLLLLLHSLIKTKHDIIHKSSTYKSDKQLRSCVVILLNMDARELIKI